MLDEIKEFFSSFAEDVPKFDGTLIAKRYRSPYLVVSATGDLWLCENETDTIDYFQTLLDKHESQGVVKCEYHDFECTSIGDNNFMATVSWTTRDEKGETITTWRESYNMCKTAAGFKIYTSIDH